MVLPIHTIEVSIKSGPVQVTLEQGKLVFRFPEVHREAVLHVHFQRTLRIPDDSREYALPPGLGAFPLAHVDDYQEKVPPAWSQHGGVFLPMYQTEALWISFLGWHGYPFAVRVAAGKINAVTGAAWDEGISGRPQDYLVAPDQPWLDGFCVSKGSIRQFVAMPLGEGYTAEEQLTGEAEHGGLQLLVHPMKADRYEALRRRSGAAVDYCLSESMLMRMEAPAEMGLAPGGLMRQEIYEDRYGIDAWDRSQRSRCFVHILNSLQYTAVTGTTPPTRPPTAKDYTKAGLPWFDYYDAEQKALQGAAELAGLDSVAAKGVKKGEKPLPDNDPVEPKVVKKLGPHPAVVREGEF